MRRGIAVVVMLVAMSTVACNKAYVVHPGAANTFDSQTYDILVTAHAAIEQTKTEIANKSFTGATLRNVTIGLNALIDAYNPADTAYKAYHAAATANPPTATQSQVNDLNAKTQSLPALVSNLNAAKVGR